MKGLFVTLILWTGFAASAQELGTITKIDRKTEQVQFYIGNVDVQVGEILSVYNSFNVLDLKLRVVAVDPPYATGEFAGYEANPGHIEPMHKNRRVRLSLDKTQAVDFSFLLGPDFSSKVGGFGGSNYALGLNILFHLPQQWLLNLQLQADDLGKDPAGNGKRVSYYMLGAGRELGPVQLLLNLGEADYMTMPAVSTGNTVDPYTGATYPNNVEHKSKLAYQFMAKYQFHIREPNRNASWGWGISPAVTYGSAFSPAGYKPTVAVLACFDFTRVF
jgi:hypothetical protein